MVATFKDTLPPCSYTNVLIYFIMSLYVYYIHVYTARRALILVIVSTKIMILTPLSHSIKLLFLIHNNCKAHASSS
jgi:hypothetical protein